MPHSQSFVRVLKLLFPHRYLPARLTRLPLLGGAVDRLLFAGDEMLYVPKNAPAARSIVVGEGVELPDEMVLPGRIVDHFVEEAGYHWIMNACICRDAGHCTDYPIDLGCLFLGRAAMDINPRLGRRATRDEALAHVRRCREAGLVHLIGRNKLDTVWLGVGPGDRLLTVCNCCPCCCLWRMLPDLAPRIGARVSRLPGVRVVVSQACVGCGTCVQSRICFVNAIALGGDGGRAVIGDACRGCGRCVSACPNGAIELTIEDARAAERAIAGIERLVDVT